MGKKSDCLLALDIGTEVVKALVFWIDDEKGKVIVAGVGKEAYSPNSIRVGVISNVKEIVLSCRKAIDSALKMSGLGAPNQAIIGVGGGLARIVSSTVCYERESPKAKIDTSELRKIVRKAQREMTSSKRRLRQEEGVNEEMRMVEAGIGSISIDGYGVVDPLNFRGRDVRLDIIGVYISADNFDKIERIANELDVELLTVTFGSYAVVRAIGAQDYSKFGAVFVDIGGSVTELVLVQNGSIKSTNFFSIGGRTFTKRISNVLKLEWQEAEDVKEKYSRNKLDAALKNKIEGVIRSDCSLWFSGVELALKEFASESVLLPPRIMVYGGGSLLSQLISGLEEFLQAEDLPVAEKLEVDYVKPDDFVDVVDKVNKLSNPQYVTSISLACLAANSMDRNDATNRILREIMLEEGERLE